MEGKKEMQVQTEALITVEASSQELPAIDAAVRGYIQLLRFAVNPSHDRDKVIAQLRSFQRRYEEPLKIWRARQHMLARPDTPSADSEQLISWEATSFELLVFGSAVVGYLHMLENTHAPSEVRSRMVSHLLAFERRYMERQALVIPSSCY